MKGSEPRKEKNKEGILRPYFDDSLLDFDHKREGQTKGSPQKEIGVLPRFQLVLQSWI